MLRSSAARCTVAAILACALAVACGRDDDAARRAGDPASHPAAKRPGSHPEVAEKIRMDREAVRSPSDGGGRAWLEPDPDDPGPLRIGTFHRFHLVYEAGPLGVAVGGRVYLQVSPF